MVSLLLGVAERPNPRDSRDMPAPPQAPSCNFIRYRTTRQLPDASSRCRGLAFLPPTIFTIYQRPIYDHLFWLKPAQ